MKRPFEETLEDEFEITFLKIELALLNTRQTNFSSDLSHPMAPMHMPRPLILMGHFDMWKKNETQWKQQLPSHKQKGIEINIILKRFSCICSYFWEYSQTNDERTKFLMKTARAPPNRRIKVCEISKKSLQMQKHLKKFLDLLFVEKILISNQINSLTYQFPDTFFTLLPH